MTPREEAVAILSICDDNVLKALQMLESQLTVVHSRSQVLTSLAGVVVTVTGFSGRIIANTNTTAQVLIIAGLAIVLFAAIYTFQSVMQLKWVTSELGECTVDSLERVIIRRNRKTRAYRIGGRILGVGLILYGLAVAVMLLNPEPLGIAAR
ncbi:MAG: hypothetical protein ACYTGH_06585 [Planctomycetota bacterium]|jgi:hypothetical protein